MITQLVVCLRWMNKNLDLHEEFLSLYSMVSNNDNITVKVWKKYL